MEKWIYKLSIKQLASQQTPVLQTKPTCYSSFSTEILELFWSSLGEKHYVQAHALAGGRQGDGGVSCLTINPVSYFNRNPTLSYFSMVTVTFPSDSGSHYLNCLQNVSLKWKKCSYMTLVSKCLTTQLCCYSHFQCYAINRITGMIWLKITLKKKGRGGVQGAGGGTIFNQVISMIWFIPVPSAQRYVTSWKGRGWTLQPTEASTAMHTSLQAKKRWGGTTTSSLFSKISQKLHFFFKIIIKQLRKFKTSHSS